MRTSLYSMLPLVLSLAIFVTCHKGDTPVSPGSGQESRQPLPEEVAPLQPGTYYLPLIETTDIHGHIVEVESGTVHYRMAYIADKVLDIRGHGSAYDKDRLLLVDGGDLYQGASVSNLLAGKPVYVALDQMDYDAVALGNHEFDWGFDTLSDPDATLLDYDRDGRHFVNEVPIVCANLYRNGSRDPRTRDYVIVEKTALHPLGGEIRVKIGIVGFVPDYAGSIMASRFGGMGYSIQEDYAAAEALAAGLESSGACDATILLIHGPAEQAARRLAPDSVFDLVVGGHSHTLQSGWTQYGMPYLQGGRYAEHYAFARLLFQMDEDGSVSFSKVDYLQNYPVDTARDQHAFAGQNAYDLSEDILALSDQTIGVLSEKLNDVIGYIDVSATSYPISGSGERASVISNWMCDILRRIGEADVSFVNSGGVRTSMPLNGQARRDVTVADIYELFPFDNATYIYQITYSELLQLFRYALTSGGGSLFSSMTGIDCHYHDGTVRMLQKDGTVIYRNGSWTGDWASRRLTLAVSEYLATTERTDYYTLLPNPLLEWNGTSRLVDSSLQDNENAVRVLREEAAASGGRLHIDTAPHFILSN
jgi:2',3'-cyclic-nucleotide 2'-phosphodiesterase (5'-nucleotidase family)